ncbi:hypothetical protein [Celeribacter halophilus]|uniref:hypothetical protein n=1 Tax=Celeribacter halophilus TaxID=576117 RepID=UPI003A929B29
MALKMTVTNVFKIKTGIWEFDMPPHQVQHFGKAGHAIGQKSVLLFHSCNYDPDNNHLHFDPEDVSPINVGTSTKVIGIAVETEVIEANEILRPEVPNSTAFGPGDREFLRLANSELSEATANVAKLLLAGVRQKSPGDLKRGKLRNFSETPDNFWYVIIQPRIDELAITVRGTVDHFKPVARLEIKDDRGNTRFKVKSKDDLPAALQIIFHAIRKS